MYQEREEEEDSPVLKSVGASIKWLEDYIEKHEGGLMTAIKTDTDNTMTNRMTMTREQKWEEKQLYGRFKRLINNTSHEKSRTLKESLLIEVQSNTVRTIHIKARIDNKIANVGYVVIETKRSIIISECSKLAQKDYKTRHDWVGKVIHREMCKKFKFDQTNKLYMQNPASVQENDTHKLQWDFDIQTDHLISARRPYLIIINKKENLQNCGICCLDWI